MTAHRYIGLDLMRTVAVLLVLVCHSLLFLQFEKGKDFLFLYLGFIGVEIFFVLSGFLIGNIMYKAFSKTVNGNTMRSFWIRRWFRTLPMYYIALLLNIIIYISYFGTGELSAKIFLYPFFLQNLIWPHPHFFDPAWSLTIEEYFYLLFPILMFLLFTVFKIKFRKSFLLAIALFFFVPLLLRLLFHLSVEFKLINQLKSDFVPNWDLHFRKITVFRVDSISLGILVAYLMNNYRAKLVLFKKHLMIASILLFFISTYIYYHSVYHYHFNLISSVWIFPLFSISFAMSLPYLRELKSLGHFNRPVSFISKISYSIYLLHTLISFFILQHLMLSNSVIYQLTLWILFIAISIIVSAFSFTYIENPLTELREKYGRSEEKVIPPAKVVES